MVGYCNEAIQEAVDEIQKLSEDYFLKSDTINLVQGQSKYSMPSDICANMIRSLIYNNGAGIIYPVRRVRGAGENRFLDETLTTYFGTAQDYRYDIENTDSTTGFQIVLIPPARESGAFITRRYLRQANYVPLVSSGSQNASDATVVDIPEFYTFIIQFMKCRCLEKEGSDPRLPQAAAILEHQREMMVSTLSNRVPDDDNTIIPDMTHYFEHE